MWEETLTLRNRQGLTMVGTLLCPEEPSPRPGVLVLHGFRGNRLERHIRRLAEALAQGGLVSLALDLTHNLGGSDGDFSQLTLTQEVEDTAAALNALAALPQVDALRLGIAGHSLGGLVAALHAARDPRIKALVTLSAVFDLKSRLVERFGPEQLLRWKEEGRAELDPPGCGLFLNYHFYQDLERYHIPAEIQGIRCPFLILHGAQDEEVPQAHARHFYDYASSPVKELALLPEADHTFTRDQDLERVAHATVQWFRRTLGAGNP